VGAPERVVPAASPEPAPDAAIVGSRGHGFRICGRAAAAT
jgi:hypothetical protein